MKETQRPVGLFGFVEAAYLTLGNNLRSIYQVTFELDSAWEVGRGGSGHGPVLGSQADGVNRGSAAYGAVILVTQLKHMKQDLEHGKRSLTDYKWQSTDSYPGLSQRDDTKQLFSPLEVGFIISVILQVRKPRSREVE